MNPPIPRQLQQHLLSAGYEIRPELGDTVITQLDSQHFIYVQVRDNKKTYIPITITTPVNPESQIPGDSFHESNTPDLNRDMSISDVTPEIAQETETLNNEIIIPETEMVPVLPEPEPGEDNQIWDENMMELFGKIDQAKNKLKNLLS